MKKSKVDIDLKTRMKIALDAARVFQYMHALGIVHRDIKSHNILIDDNMGVKICDFGLARFRVSRQIVADPLFRPTLVRERCSMLVRQFTWLQNFSRNGSTTKKLMCSPTVRSSGNLPCAKFLSTASRRGISVPAWKRANILNCERTWTQPSDS